MNAMKVMNRAPGFVPLGIRPVSVAGRQPIAPARFAPAPYRPSMLANPAKAALGQSAFNLSELPVSLTLGLAGAGAFVLSGVLPTPLKEAATIGGFTLLGWGVLNLFSGSAEAATESAAGAQPFDVPPMDEFNKVSAKIVKPTLGQEVSRGLFSYDYDVEVLWTNLSDKPVSVPYRIYVQEKPEGGIAQEDFSGVVYNGVVNLGPRQAVPVPLELDLQHRGFGAASAVGITMKVQKVASSGQVFDADQRFFVVY